MLWLFGQIWVWLLIAFVLGAGVAALVLNKVYKDRAEAAAATGAGPPARPSQAPPPVEAERTEQIPLAVGATDDVDDMDTQWLYAGRPEGEHSERTEPELYGVEEPEVEHVAYDDYDGYDYEEADLELAELDSDPELTGVITPVDGEPDADEELTGVMTPVEGEPDLGPPDLGHREGTLPSNREWHQRNEWPDEHDLADGESPHHPASR